MSVRLPAPLDVGDGPHDPAWDSWGPNQPDSHRPEPVCIPEPVVPDPMPAAAVTIRAAHVAAALVDLAADIFRRVTHPHR